MAKLKLPFELEKPSSNEYVTQTSEIGHNGDSLDTIIDDIVGGESQTIIPISGFEECAWVSSGGKASKNSSPSNPNARGVSQAISLNKGDRVVLTTATYSVYVNMYLLCETDGTIFASKTPQAVGVEETNEIVASKDCLLYINAMSNHNFSCTIYSESQGVLPSLQEDVANAKLDIEALKNRESSVDEDVDNLNVEVFGVEGDIEETDYSTFEITHNYFNASLNVSASERYDMTGYIAVEQGNHIVISGKCDPAIAMVVGYTDNQGSGKVALLTGIGTANNEDVEIPEGINYVRCCARNTNYPNVTYNMTVTLISGIYPYDGLVQRLQKTNENLANKETLMGKTIVVPQNKKIMLVGASFTIAGNGWDKLVQDSLGVEIINKAVGGSNIVNNVAALMLDANANQPHGSLFMVNGVDVFDDVGALIIHHVHNQNVLLDEDKYLERDVNYYKTNGVQAGDYASGFDYVLKQYKEWCNATTSVEETIQDVTRDTIYGTHPCQILLVSHWLPSRALYNATSRALANRFKIAYCPLDTNVGISSKDKVYCVESTDAAPTPSEGWFNPSVLHSQFVNVSGNNPIGKTEVIDGITWGWHPLLLSSTRNYGYGTVVNRMGVTQYVPFIQRLIASIVEKSISVF